MRHPRTGRLHPCVNTLASFIVQGVDEHVNKFAPFTIEQRRDDFDFVCLPLTAWRSRDSTASLMLELPNLKDVTKCAPFSPLQVPPDMRVGAKSPSAVWHKAFKAAYALPLDYEAMWKSPRAETCPIPGEQYDDTIECLVKFNGQVAEEVCVVDLRDREMQCSPTNRE